MNRENSKQMQEESDGNDNETAENQELSDHQEPNIESTVAVKSER